MTPDVELKWTPSQEYTAMYRKDVVTPMEVRNAIVECMTHAVGGDRGIAEMTVKHQFKNAGLMWDNPTRDGLVLVMNRLRDVAMTYRSREVIDSNFRKIMRLLQKCEC